MKKPITTTTKAMFALRAGSSDIRDGVTEKEEQEIQYGRISADVFRLTPEQIATFHREGCVRIENVLTEQEVDEIERRRDSRCVDETVDATHRCDETRERLRHGLLAGHITKDRVEPSLWKLATHRFESVTIDVAGILSTPSSFSVYRGTTVTPANLLEEIEFKGGTIELAVTAGQTYTLVGIVRIDEERVASGSMSVDLSFESSGGGVALAPVDVRLVNSNGALSIECTPDPKTAAGSRYEVQFSGDLRSPWTPIGSDISANSFDLGAIVSPSGFYRIVASTP